MMSTPHRTFCLGVVVMCLGPASAVWYEYWTGWVDRDYPSGNGDSETRVDFGKQLASCPYPNGIECQTTGGVPYDDTGDKFEKVYACTIMLGLACHKGLNNGRCSDYKTRYRCNRGGDANPCTKNNGLCTHQCNYCTNCKSRWCRCFPGYNLMSDHKTCSEPLRCFECNSIKEPTKCGKISKTDDTILQLPCNTMCFTGRDWDGNYHRGCADADAQYPSRLLGSGYSYPKTRYKPYMPPSKPGTDSWPHPWHPNSPVQYTFCNGDLCNGNGGSAKIIKGYGSLSSQNYPLNYTNSVQTTYVIYAAHKMKVTFSHFSIEGHPDCGWDSLTLRNGETSSSPLIGKFCDSTKPPGSIVTSGKTLYVQFKTDGSVQRTGFKMSWTN